MSEKKYVSPAKLGVYHSKLKSDMASADQSTLEAAKSFATEELEGFAGEVNTAIDTLTGAIDDLETSKADTEHSHAINDITGLQAELDKIDDHISNSDVHFTADERTKLSGIAEKANNYTHPNSGVTAGTYKSVTVNAQGHVTAGSNPTTLAGYGITDAEAKGTVNTHNTATDAHNDIRVALNELTTKVTNFLNVTDTTKDQLSEIIALIEENADSIETITSGKVNVTDIINNLTTNVANKPLSAAQGVVLAGLVEDLTTSLGTTNTNLSTLQTTVSNHTANKDNPHGVTKAQVGLGNVPNVVTNDQTVTYTVASANADLTSGEKLSVAFGKIAKAINSFLAHIANVANPHSVTKAQVGLGNVDNTADADKTVKSATTATTLSGLTATVAELNYMDGVTSNVQTQLDGKSNTGHGHAIGDVTGLQTELDGKSANGHGHAIADVTNLQSTLDSMQEAIDEAASSSGGGGGSFDFDAYANLSGYSYTYNKASGQEVISYSGSTFATRTSTKDSDGNWTITVVCSSAGINSTRKWTKDTSGNWSAVDV